MSGNAKNAKAAEGTAKAVEERVPAADAKELETLNATLNAPNPMDLDGLEAESQGQGQIQIGMKDGRLEIEDLVVNPTWREILMDLVVSEQLDTWNLDITDITSKYIERVKHMKDLDLHVPANVILAAAILLRLKSDALKLEEEQVPEELYAEESPLGDVQMLHMRMRVPPKRGITLTDLVKALDEVMTLETMREQRKRERVQVMELKLPKYDIESEMSSVLELARKTADEKGWLTFSGLIEKRQDAARKETENEALVFTFLPLLYLEHHNKLSLVQDKIFGEILINILPDNGEPVVVNDDSLDNA